MFERYTEMARRTIFFARFDASQDGAPAIETEHLLLGLLRDKQLFGLIGDVGKLVESIHLEVDSVQPKRVPISTSTDLPLSQQSKRVLTYGAEEAQRIGHEHIGTEHLLLGLLREEDCLAARLLRQHGTEIEALRERISKGGPPLAETEPAPVDSPVDRDALHTLVNSLPEGALFAVCNMLKRMQTWPMGMASQLAAMRRQWGSGMTGSSSTGWSGPIHEGSHSSSRTEDGAVIRETRTYVQGHEITILEKLKISDDGKKIGYSQQLHGPKADHLFDIDFDIT
jgi:hypothetical protein